MAGKGAILGIDPGATGAVAVLSEDGQLLAVHDIPSTLDTKRRPTTNAPLLAEIIAGSHANIAYCEFVSARPTDAKTAAFAFGRARGIIEGICGAYNIRLIFLTPPVWKRFTGVPPGEKNKPIARTRAIAYFPEHAALFKREKDVDRADACLIGLTGLHRETAKTPIKAKWQSDVLPLFKDKIA